MEAVIACSVARLVLLPLVSEHAWHRAGVPGAVCVLPAFGSGWFTTLS